MSVPTVVLVAIGDELLNGRTVNTNAAWLGRVLEEAGARLARVVTVGDDTAEIVAAIRDASADAELILCSGGLGPTEDDRTRQAVAAAADVELREDPATLDWLRRRFERAGRPMAESNRRQAAFPEGARVLRNPIGSAPGFLLRTPPASIAALPGVPSEFRRLAGDHVLPFLRAEWGDRLRPGARVVLRTTGESESGLADRLERLDALRGVALASLPGTGGVDLHVVAADPDALARAEATLREELGRSVYGTGDVDLVEVVGESLRARGWKLAVAESCTGGLLAQRITSFSGASDYFLGGVVAYADRAKHALAGVDEDLLARHGAVSAEVARALAAGTLGRFAADAALAITGVAGPGGGTERKPVGTVFVAVRTPEADEVRQLSLPGDRDAVRERSAQAALDLLRRSM
jgi:nicotinamide-nucleotide amidase